MARPRTCIILVGLLSFWVCRAHAGPPTYSATNLEPLIDRLVETSNEDYAVQTNILNTPGNPVGNGEKGLLPLGTPVPSPSEARSTLVARDYGAIAILVAHLDDKRPTKFTVKHDGGFGAMMRGDEYDYNRCTTAPPEGVDHEFWHGAILKNHTLTVGDLCFEILGQIVNRHFDPIRYQPTMCIIINSPTDSESLLKAIRKEWGDLPREQYRDRLIADICTPDHELRAEYAIPLLLRADPDALETAALQRLRLPTYDDSIIQIFVENELYAAQDAKAWKAAAERLVAEHGPGFRDGLLLLLREHQNVERWSDPPPWKDMPKKILPTLFPGHDAGKPYYAQVIDAYTLARFINALATVRSTGIDDAVYELFKGLGTGLLDQDTDDYLAASCMHRLIGKQHDAEFAKYCEKRVPLSRNPKALRKILDNIRSLQSF